MFSFLFSSVRAADYSFTDIKRVVNEFKKAIEAGDTITAKGSETKNNFILFTNFDYCLINITLTNRTTKKIDYQYHYDSSSLEPFIQCLDYDVEIKIQAQQATKVKFTIFATNDCPGNGYSFALNYPSSMNFGSRSQKSYSMESYTNRCAFGAFEYDTKIKIISDYYYKGTPSLPGSYSPCYYSYYSAVSNDTHRENVEKETLTAFDSSFLFDFHIYLAGEAQVITTDTGSTATKSISDAFKCSVPEQTKDDQDQKQDQNQEQNNPNAGKGTKSDYIIGVVVFLLIVGLFALVGYFVVRRMKHENEESSIEKVLI